MILKGVNVKSSYEEIALGLTVITFSEPLAFLV